MSHQIAYNAWVDMLRDYTDRMNMMQYNAEQADTEAMREFYQRKASEHAEKVAVIKMEMFKEAGMK